MEQKELSLNDIWKELFCEKEEANIYLNAMSGIVDKKYTHVVPNLDGKVPKKDIENCQETDAFNNYAIECRKKLNEIFMALLGCKYEKILKKEAGKYKFSRDTADFIKILIATYRTPEGKDIRKKTYFISDFDILEDEINAGEVIYFGMKELANEGRLEKDWAEIKSRLDIRLKNPLRIIKSQISAIEGIIDELLKNEQCIGEKVEELNGIVEILKKCEDKIMEINVECKYK